MDDNSDSEYTDVSDIFEDSEDSIEVSEASEIDEDIDNISEPSDTEQAEEDTLDETTDDFENIKINTSNKIDVGDLKKINRNTLKKKYSKLPNIAKNIIKYYKNVDIPVIPEYNYNIIQNILPIKINNNNIQILYSQYDKLYDYFKNNKSEIKNNKSEIKNIDINYNLFDNNNFTEQIINNQKTCRYLIEKPKVYESDTIVCNKCKSKKVVFYSLQTRSCDEPMTNFYTCLNCSKKWKS